MVRLMAAALDAWEDDPSVMRVVDLRRRRQGVLRRRRHPLALRIRTRRGTRPAADVLREEYQLNERIRTLFQAHVALIDGIVMGGGVGVSINASHRVAGERFSFAMPEVGIGFFPDVGGTYFLPRLQRRVGVYLALTGLRANAGDVAGVRSRRDFRSERRFRRAGVGARKPGTTSARRSRRSPRRRRPPR